MSRKRVYHLALSDDQLEGARIALLPGDPGRVEMIATTRPFQNARFLTSNREYTSWLGYIAGTPVLVVSTGIGGSSASIAVDELAQLGIRTFLRVGTTGAIQPQINIGDVIITTGAVRLNGVSTHYAPIEYPAVADHDLVEAFVAAAQELKIPYHVGITCSSATFYPGQERYDSFSGCVPKHLQGTKGEWQRLHVLNYEMEAATVLTLCSAFGLRGGCVTGIVSQRAKEQITEEGLRLGEENVVKVAVKAAEILLGA